MQRYRELKIIEYSPAWFESVRQAVEPRKPESALLHRPFVDYYYASQDWCTLFLALDKNEKVVGTLGLDRMNFESEGVEMTIGFGSNYNSFLPGVGSFLFLRRLKDCPLGLVFWTSEETQKVIRSLGWTYFPNVRRQHLNYSYRIFGGESMVRKLAKLAMQCLPKRKIGNYAARLEAARNAGVSVQAVPEFFADLLPAKSAFAFRFAPSLEYLNWRYNSGLSFVRYRLFRINVGLSTVGYVVINEMADRITVAQCDGTDPVTLAYGVMLSIFEVGKHDSRPRSVMLTSSHPVMQRLYREFGFRISKSDECFAIGGYKQPVTLNRDTSNWLVNFDWGNNELQTPFLDQDTSVSFRSSYNIRTS